MTELLIIGGGITGLAAAWEAVQVPGVEVTLIDTQPRLGGKILSSPISLPNDQSMIIDEGADAFLCRVPDAVQLCRELGLESEFTHPAMSRAQVFVDGALHFLPTDTVLGVPLEFEPLAASGLLSDAGMQRAREEVQFDWPAPIGDVSIGGFLTERYGRELVDHVVAPLIGGINAGDVDTLSMQSVTPQLYEAAMLGGSLTLALRQQAQRAAVPSSTPVFTTLLGGISVLIETLQKALKARGVQILSPAQANKCYLADQGKILTELAAGSPIEADSVLICTSAPIAAELLRQVSTQTASLLQQVSYSSVALVTFVFERNSVPGELLASGFLVPRLAQMCLTAASVGSTKWAHWDDGKHVVLRVSAGHDKDKRSAKLSDDQLRSALLADLQTTLGITDPPLATRVSRWPDGFAQYRVGHKQLVEEIEYSLATDCPQILLAGASYRGLGIPACIRQGRTAAKQLIDC
ncbi:MAG: protoporphyrinogen oxidase [Microthrixaceae bacterium]